MKKTYILLLLAALCGCNYLDVVPDNIPTIENAFTLRSSAERFLFTCYSYMPANGHFNDNVAFNCADEIWHDDPPRDIQAQFHNIAKGQQNVSNPLGNFWGGTNRGKALFIGLRDCNTFIANIDKVQEMTEYERDRWKAEVKFLKAYYHFFLFRMYGPIPLMKENLPISASPEEVQVARMPVDSCVNYIVQLLDEAYASPNLPEMLAGSEGTEMGRITKPIVLALKAKVLVTAASPMFNGNTDYASLKDKTGKGAPLFNQTYSVEKWRRAMDACREAIEFCHSQGYALYHFPGMFGYVLNDTIQTELDFRVSLTTIVNNTEVIWANTNSTTADMQRWSMPLIAEGASTSGPKGILSPTIKMVEQFYSKNGVPIDEDRTWDYARRYTLRKAKPEERFYVAEDQETVQLHFDREPRFYASVSFDRGTWFGNWIGNYDVTKPLFYPKMRAGEISSRRGISNYSVTGYNIKKLVNIETSVAADGNFTSNLVNYPWPEFRLADLYLLYAEALNEVNGSSAEAMGWIDQVRARAGLKGVAESWTNFSNEPLKYQTKEGLREIIQHERSVELAFEGQRFWDLLRWKTAHIALNAPIKGWDITQKDAPSYYKERLLFNQRFTIRDYLWPIELNEMTINHNLVQNPGW
ncbi:RagB/SusD family nutrient uptake outer membrane protein [Chitinophaga barathri]|uniref:RagB/SusD family nutrient uptake outer membrane protein n=1 Tax=Chitinophaga barathri TaxID=1647451 RepID=A0A3N4M8E8_9BACT|nr:RagB/SusD family nutrient uptake outer membrane protein [Chitinophaga barathri]RPD39884.1 RagB/SusD family nutrient uptake outer membrane protein [Chitinophaga barathri]